jgi:hypothetical protein
MNKPSERIVVFVTPAQKRAISSTADELGISVSELMRRAVIAFSATSDQVKAASIVDRLNAPRRPDALAQVLQKAAKPLRVSRPGAIRPPAVDGAAAGTLSSAQLDAQLDNTGADGEAHSQEAQPAPLPAAHTDEPDVSHAAREIAQAVARLNAEAAAADSAALDAANAQAHLDDPLQSLSATPFARSRRDADDARDDAAPEGGKFA